MILLTKNAMPLVHDTAGELSWHGNEAGIAHAQRATQNNS
jgi:hypothetical protein